MSRVIDPADPNRCQFTFPHEQCWNEAAPGTDKCLAHGGGPASEDAAHRLYHLTEVRSQNRLQELTEHDQVKALREVIALARRLVEKRFNLVRNDAEFLEACGPVNTLQLTVERLTKSAHNIELSLDTLLSKSFVFKLGQLIIRISAEELTGIENYDATLNRITTRIVSAIAGNGSPQSSVPSLPALVREAVIVAEKPMFVIADAEDKVRLAQLSRHERLKSLNEDIGLSALMIERRWNMIKTDPELIQAVPALNTMLRTLERLIKSAHEIEQALGYLLSEESIRRLGSQISDILVEELQGIDNYESYIDTIMDRIADTLANPQPKVVMPAKITHTTSEASTLGPSPADDSDSAESEE